ncbi:MAG: DUF4159 domain-containing protein, partial [Saprospiraceae bacterium]|nr:DUF4159 domain-containing protein [Saprospiraceae bacterium]
MNIKTSISIFVIAISSIFLSFSPPSYKIALLKYNGGGDWYANPTALTNLASFCNQLMITSIDPDYATVDVGSIEVFNFPFLHMTGHG